MTTWWWVRHAPTHEQEMLGWRDVPADLSDRAAIARLEAILPKTAVVVSSDLVRAVATADAIAAGRERLPHAPALREFNFGDWDGLAFDAVAKRDPDLSLRFWQEPGEIAPPGGESWHDVAERVGGFVATMNQRFAGRDIVAVAHIGVIMTQIGLARGQSPTAAICHRIANLSVTRLICRAKAWHIGVINQRP